MEGVLDSLVRELLSEIKEYDLCITEFLRVVDSLLPVKSFYRLCPELHNQSRTPSGTAVRAVKLGSWGVDLNCCCPSKTVNGSGGGASLLKNPDLIYRGAKTMREAVPAGFPVTVKVRMGWDSGGCQFEIADVVQQAGATELVMHGRTNISNYL
ncbi:tRNA-dihydrouridine synthase C [Xenorhabdus koppenhoeferi]|uniref:tRNA-dihydrouridine synthase C n=1 Tax=Xenorhabdus koppenhoeferi TaxID=351659 RepID=A0A1I7HU54_9GAMM|nr:tRNA-dihydrouridine synthase C [Xenorhabdus koppenhoeferi]